MSRADTMPAGVLAVLDWDSAASNRTEEKFRAAHATVAELVEAARKADAAMLLADWNVPAACTARQHEAYRSNAAALARFGDARMERQP